MYTCPFCESGQVEIPHWMPDVESMEKVLVPCPVCDGKHWLTKEQWDERQHVLDGKDNGSFTALKIETTLAGTHVELSSANLIAFDLKYEQGKTIQDIADVCAVAPHMMALDSDLAEAYDDAFRTQPKQADTLAVYRFLQKYKARIDPADLYELFDLKEPR